MEGQYITTLAAAHQPSLWPGPSPPPGWHAPPAAGPAKHSNATWAPLTCDACHNSVRALTANRNIPAGALIQ
eukprot:6498861-Prorocentrum_lima.AAC.1